MRVEDIMSVDPLQCRPETGLAEVARMMAEYDCGEIPVCDAVGKPLGVVTDRDIVCRMVAKGEDPRTHRAEECMTTPVVTARPEMSIDDCAGLMAQHRVRRLPVVNERGVCCGIVAQADLARKAPPTTVANVLESVSEEA
jgi:CBS domain-containing protein